MIPITNVSGKAKKKERRLLQWMFIEDEFRQSINVTVSMNNPSASSNPQVYECQRTIHCQKQVSIEKWKRNVLIVNSWRWRR